MSGAWPDPGAIFQRPRTVLSAGVCLSGDFSLGKTAVRSSCGSGEIGERWRVKTCRLALLASALLSFSLVSADAEATWLTDLSKAQAEAKAQHKLLLLDFTGSDWCIWCKKLDAEVFKQPEFGSYAKEHLVLLTVDFPRKTAIAPEVKKQNEELAQKFGIEGFPTIVVLNGDGKQVGELGYEPGGPSAFLKQLKKLPGH